MNTGTLALIKVSFFSIESIAQLQRYEALTIGNGQVKALLISGSTACALINFNNGSNGFFNRGNGIRFAPGCNANAGSYFHARMGNCNTTLSPRGCN